MFSDPNLPFPGPETTMYLRKISASDVDPNNTNEHFRVKDKSRDTQLKTDDIEYANPTYHWNNFGIGERNGVKGAISSFQSAGSFYESKNQVEGKKVSYEKGGDIGEIINFGNKIKDNIRSETNQTDDITGARANSVYPLLARVVRNRMKERTRKEERRENSIENNISKLSDVVINNRPVNLSLTTADIEYAQPKKATFISKRKTNPLQPRYSLPVCKEIPYPGFQENKCLNTYFDNSDNSDTKIENRRQTAEDVIKEERETSMRRLYGVDGVPEIRESWKLSVNKSELFPNLKENNNNNLINSRSSLEVSDINRGPFSADSLRYQRLTNPLDPIYHLPSHGLNVDNNNKNTRSGLTDIRNSVSMDSLFPVSKSPELFNNPAGKCTDKKKKKKKDDEDIYDINTLMKHGNGNGNSALELITFPPQESKPRVLHRHSSCPSVNLHTKDIRGARSIRYVGAREHSIYDEYDVNDMNSKFELNSKFTGDSQWGHIVTKRGIESQKKKYNSRPNLHSTIDIHGATANSLKRGIVTRRSVNPLWPEYSYNF